MKKIGNKIINDTLSIFIKYKYAFFSSLLFSFLTHFYFFTKRLANEDDLNYLVFKDYALPSGRWNGGTLLTTNLMSPPIKFLLVLIILGVISVLICDIFNIKKKKNMVLISLVLTCFPTLALSFSFLFMVETYLLSLLFACISVWLFVKYKNGFIPGSLFLAFSLGSYQSYICTSISLIVIYLITEILDKKDTKKVLIKALKALIMGAAGVLLYFIILKIMLSINNEVLSTYKGADSMGIPPISDWPKLLFRTYKHFIGYFIGLSYYHISKFEVLIRIITIISSFVVIILKSIKEKLYKNKLSFVLLLILILTIPLSFNLVDFMAYKTELSALQVYYFVMLYVFIIVIIEKYVKSKALSTILTILIVIISIFNYMACNQYYFKLDKYYSYTESFNNRLLTRIESTKGFNYDIPIMFVGDNNGEFYKELYTFPIINDTLTFDQPLWGGKFIGYVNLYCCNSDRRIFTMLENQFGIKLTRADKEDREKVLNSKEYKTITNYPDSESIKIINGIMVIKL